MDLRQLHFFTTLADTLNFHRAAERLNISQPPISIAIRKLEQELGAELFERVPRGVRLTSAGEAGLAAARATLAHAGQFRNAVREGANGDRGILRLGFVGSSVFALLPELIPAFRERHPGVELSLKESTTHEMVPAILSGDLDAALIRLPLLDYAELDLTVIEHDELIAAVPADSRFSAEAPLDLSALAGEPFISLGRTSILRSTALLACHERGFVPRIAQEVPQLSTVLFLVQSGLGVALVPANVRLNAPEGVRLLPLREPPRIDIGLALPPCSASPAALNFRSLAISKCLGAHD